MRCQILYSGWSNQFVFFAARSAYHLVVYLLTFLATAGIAPAAACFTCLAIKDMTSHAAASL